jgi:hypothetical protein
MTVTVGKIKDSTVQIMRVTDEVAFSDQKGWIMICLDWQQAETRKSQFKWVPITTRFEWVREFIG